MGLVKIVNLAEPLPNIMKSINATIKVSHN